MRSAPLVGRAELAHHEPAAGAGHAEHLLQARPPGRRSCAGRRRWSPRRRCRRGTAAGCRRRPRTAARAGPSCPARSMPTEKSHGTAVAPWAPNGSLEHPVPAARSRTRSPRRGADGLDHRPSPAALDAGRHQVVGEVVALGHGVEHATYVGRLLVQVSAGHAASVGVRTPGRATRGCRRYVPMIEHAAGFPGEDPHATPSHPPHVVPPTALLLALLCTLTALTAVAGDDRVRRRPPRRRHAEFAPMRPGDTRLAGAGAAEPAAPARPPLRGRDQPLRRARPAPASRPSSGGAAGPPTASSTSAPGSRSSPSPPSPTSEALHNVYTPGTPAARSAATPACGCARSRPGSSRCAGTTHG